MAFEYPAILYMLKKLWLKAKYLFFHKGLVEYENKFALRKHLHKHVFVFFLTPSFSIYKQGWPNGGSRAACGFSDPCWGLFEPFAKLKNYMGNLRMISCDDLFF